MIAALPDGVYTRPRSIDGDGVSDDPIPGRVAVRIAATEMRSISPAACGRCHGPINCARGAVTSAVKTVFKAIVAPQEPSNEGWFRPLKVMAPDWHRVHREKPSPTGWYYEGSAQASELVWKALAPLVPERFTAGHRYTSLCVTYSAATGA